MGGIRCQEGGRTYFIDGGAFALASTGGGGSMEGEGNVHLVVAAIDLNA